jgi:hypothetical protein
VQSSTTEKDGLDNVPNLIVIVIRALPHLDLQPRSIESQYLRYSEE